MNGYNMNNLTMDEAWEFLARLEEERRSQMQEVLKNITQRDNLAEENYSGYELKLKELSKEARMKDRVNTAKLARAHSGEIEGTE